MSDDLLPLKGFIDALQSTGNVFFSRLALQQSVSFPHLYQDHLESRSSPTSPTAATDLAAWPLPMPTIQPSSQSDPFQMQASPLTVTARLKNSR